MEIFFMGIKNAKFRSLIDRARFTNAVEYISRTFFATPDRISSAAVVLFSELMPWSFDTPYGDKSSTTATASATAFTVLEQIAKTSHWPTDHELKSEMDAIVARSKKADKFFIELSDWIAIKAHVAVDKGGRTAECFVMPHDPILDNPAVSVVDVKKHCTPFICVRHLVAGDYKWIQITNPPDEADIVIPSKTKTRDYERFLQVLDNPYALSSLIRELYPTLAASALAEIGAATAAGAKM